MREVAAAGLDGVRLATALLQRARRADAVVGLWEAADVQWWWRKPRLSDEVEKLFWLDDDGPVAGALLTSWADDAWQVDPIVVPGAPHPAPDEVWRRALEHGRLHATGVLDVAVGSGDPAFGELPLRAGLVATQHDSTAWMEATARPPVLDLPEGFVLIDRAERRDAPHPMRHRNGPAVARRLAECSLYDPELDLAVETTDGRLAGYSLYWFDATTGVGLVEPVRIEDEFQRRGLARAMLSAGIARLVDRGATRVKISFESEAAGALYRGLGFVPMSTTTWYRVGPP